MSSTIPSEFPQVSVSPPDLFLMDVESNHSTQWFFRFKPLDYDVIITLSGYVIIKLLLWAINTGFIVIHGSYTFQDGCKRRTRNGKPQEKEA